MTWSRNDAVPPFEPTASSMVLSKVTQVCGRRGGVTTTLPSSCRPSDSAQRLSSSRSERLGVPHEQTAVIALASCAGDQSTTKLVERRETVTDGYEGPTSTTRFR